MITDSNDPGLGVDNGTGVELLLLHTVDDVSLRAIDSTGTDNIHLQETFDKNNSINSSLRLFYKFSLAYLVIFPRMGVFIDLNHVPVVCTVTSTEDRVGDVPIDCEGFCCPD